MLGDLIAAMEVAIAEIDRWPDKRVQILHHNDADGLSSGAILTRAFERRGFEVHRACLEKPYPAVLEKIFEVEDRLIVLTDFAGRIAPLISDLNRGRNLVLILDHHKPEKATDERVHLLDPEVFGLRGDRDITASTTCYVFACTLDPVNQDLAYIATIGAVGDRFFVDGRLAGPNRDAALETQRQGMLEIQTVEEGERYILLTPEGPTDCSAFARNLDTFGGAGYHRGGPEIGIEVCLEGPGPETDTMLGDLRAVQERIFAGEIERIRDNGWMRTEHIQWLHVHDRFEPMGVKMIGAFLDSIRNSDIVDPERYLAGFQTIPNQVPGIGAFDFEQVKISMRVADSMEEEIRSGEVLGLDILLPEATARVGGFSDACHSLTAATTVAAGREEELIEEMEKVLAGWGTRSESGS
jgi:single-stranded-DNA-specific exonuclease